MLAEGPALAFMVLPAPSVGTFEERGATGKHDVGKQRPAQVHVGFVDGEG